MPNFEKESSKMGRGGRRPGAGRPLGSPNRLTGAFREAVQVVYNDLGGHAAFLQWARDNPSDFYKIAARLIPTEIHHKEDNNIRVIIAPVSPLPSEPRVIDATPSKTANQLLEGK